MPSKPFHTFSISRNWNSDLNLNFIYSHFQASLRLVHITKQSTMFAEHVEARLVLEMGRVRLVRSQNLFQLPACMAENTRALAVAVGSSWECKFLSKLIKQVAILHFHLWFYVSLNTSFPKEMWDESSKSQRALYRQHCLSASWG